MNLEAYFYNGDIYCEDCGKALVKQHEAEGKPYSQDSNLYPQGPYDNGGGPSDVYEHCYSCRMFLGNPLTQDGVKYTIEKLKAYKGNGNKDALDEWADNIRAYDLSREQKKVLDDFLALRKSEK